MQNATPTIAFRWRLGVAAIAACAAVWSSAYGQAPASSASTAPQPLAAALAPDPAGNGMRTAPSAEPVFGLLRPEDGTVAPLPPGTKYQDFLDWITAKRGPGYGIDSVALTARPVNESRLEVDATIQIVVHRRDEWVQIPLNFDEAVLTEFSHDGEGTCSFSRKPGDAGLAWALSGAGEHTLRLKLLVPVVTRLEETRLSLTTPAEAALTTARLELPLVAEVTPGTGIVQSTSTTDGATTIDWVGPGGSLDLSWRPKPVAAKLEDIAVETTILPTIVDKVVQLSVKQRVTAEAGRISSLNVLLPDGYALLDVKGPLYRSRREEATDAGRVVTVQLSEATAGPFGLDWQLSAPLPENETFVVEGFSLPGVPDAAQTGRVLIERAAGYRLRTLPDRSHGVRPLEMLDPESRAAATAYEFTQPFRLGLTTEAIRPEYSVTRRLRIGVAPELLSADADLSIDVKKGELKDLDLAWTMPDLIVAPIRGMNLSEERTAGAAFKTRLKVSASPSRVSIPLTGTIERDAASDRTRLTLPELTGISGQESISYGETTICLRHADAMQVRIATSGSGTVTQLTDSETAALGLPRPSSGERWTCYRATPEVTEITLDVMHLPLSVSAIADFTVRPQGEGLSVEAEVDYTIRNGSVEELRLRPPLDAVEFRLTDADGAALRTSRETSGKTPVITIDLGRPVTGTFSLLASFHVPNPKSRPTIAVPLVFPIGTDVSSARLRVIPPAGRKAEVSDATWKRSDTESADDGGRWTTDRLGNSVTLRFEPTSRGGAGSSSVSRMLLRSEIERDGIVRTIVDCRIVRPPRFLSLHFPEEATPTGYSWRGKTVQERAIPGDDGRWVELDLGPDSVAGVLHFELTSEAAQAPGFAETVALDGFRFGGGLEVGETLWQVRLPESQHLFTAPRDYSPRYRWTLSRGLWTRQATEAFPEVAAWFGGGLMEADSGASVGHRYAFFRNGGPVPLKFSLIARSLVVLVGAGAAIVIGYAFANGFVPRRGIAFGALAAVLLVLWAFFRDQVQIFLQPAAFGLLLVSVAAAGERLLRKRQERLAAQNAAPSAVDFVTILPGDGSTSAPQAPIGSEEPTVLRPGRPVSAEPVAAHGGHGSPD